MFTKFSSSPLTPAKISLDETNTPFSDVYQDCYFSRKDGLAESQYVFLEGNQLPQRWNSKENFTIAETGFGTGLNFLLSCKSWLEASNRAERLHYISIEKHPIDKTQLAKLLLNWPELAVLAKQLIDKYPPIESGVHEISFENRQIKLTLFYMDVQEALSKLNHKVDAWFLDGFSPSKNSQMWTLEIMKLIAKNSDSGTTLATFTAASQVRKNLQQAGFEVSKRKGFGKKREMLVAEML